MAQQLVLDADAVINLLPVLIDVRKRWKAGEDIAVGDEVRNVAAKLGVDDIEGFVQEQIQDHVAPVLDHAFNNDDAAEDAGAGNEVAGMLAAMAVPVGKLVYAFARKGVTANDLFDGLDAIVNENADELGEVLRVALDIDIPPEAQGLMEKYAINAVSVYCFAAAYKIYAKADEDERLAHEQRIEIERLCAESIAQLKAQREEMETLVNEYLACRLEVFAGSVVAMDRALVEQDDDGYIAASAELWNLLGYSAQYASAQEFDDLMLSNETFVL